MRINGSTVLVGVIGNPVKHSLSPAILNAAFREAEMNWVYTAFETREEKLVDAIEGIRALGIAGLSVTMPHKAKVFPLMDEISDSAQMLGVVNCIVNDGKKLKGYNTDGDGFLDAVAREYAVKYDCKAVCVNYKEEWEKSKAAALEQKKEDEEKEDIGVEEEKGERDVFANFKSYNTNKTRKDSIKRRRYRIMTDKSNQFSHKGKLEEWKRDRQPKKSSGNKRDISFSEFKAHQQ